MIDATTYDLALPLAYYVIYLIFHISMLHQYVPDDSNVLQYGSVYLDDSLTLIEKLVAILSRIVRQFCSKAIPVLKVQWRHQPIKKAT